MIFIAKLGKNINKEEIDPPQDIIDDCVIEIESCHKCDELICDEKYSFGEFIIDAENDLSLDKVWHDNCEEA